MSHIFSAVFLSAVGAKGQTVPAKGLVCPELLPAAGTEYFGGLPAPGREGAAHRARPEDGVQRGAEDVVDELLSGPLPGPIKEL